MDQEDAISTFANKTMELLRSMEDELLDIERYGGNAESVDAIFYAACTISNSARVLGLDFVASFTHIAENLLDRVRATELPMDEDMIALMLSVCDHLAVLIGHVANKELPDSQATRVSAELSIALKKYLGLQKSMAVAALGKTREQPTHGRICLVNP